MYLINKKKVLIGLSGGVDSATSVWILQELGYEVIGLTFKLLPDKIENLCLLDKGYRICCSKEAVLQARICAAKLNIPHYVVDCSNEFSNKIIDYFIDEYLSAKTPNPCVFCNKYIKFYYLLYYANMLQIDYVSTGHYADIKYNEKYNRNLLCVPADINRDQSYMLCMLPYEYLNRIILPLNNITKLSIREYAQKLGLLVANKPDSQEICFIPDGDYVRFLLSNEKSLNKVKPGYIFDTNGKILGKHKGLIYYTIGQRKGLNISYKEPLYVVKLDPIKNVVVVAEAKNAVRKIFYVNNLNWHILKPKVGETISGLVKIRYKHQAKKAYVILVEDDLLKVELLEAERGVAPGQIFAMYDENFLIAGGVISNKD